MSTTLHAHVLHRSRSVTISDVCCRPFARGCGPEEISAANHIVFPRTGVFLKTVGKEEIVGDPNHVLFFRRDEPYRVAHPVGQGDDCTVLAFSDDLLVTAVRLYQPRVEERPEQPFEFTHLRSDQPAVLAQERLRQKATSEIQEPLAVDELALEILSRVLCSAYASRSARSQARRSSTARAHLEQVQRTCLFLAAHFTENLDLEEISRAVHCSVFHLARLFKRATGLSLHQYRTQLRLRLALEQVISGQADLTRLALDLGFSSHSHLTELFHRTFGVPPSQCRRNASMRAVRQLSKNLKVAESRVF